MTSLQEQEIEKMEELRKSGLYPIVSLDIFETIADLKISDYIIEREQEVLEKYQEYLKNIFSLNKTKQDSYLKGIKTQEIMDTQVLEKEDSYLLNLFLQDKKKSALDYLLKVQRYPLNQLTREEVIESHRKLLLGTSSSQYAKKDYRDNNLGFVSKSGKGDLKILYFSLPYQDIEQGIMNLTLYYNSELHEQYTLVKPCLIHGLVGALQMFQDGNTRLGRMLQNVKIYELTEKNLKYYFPTPAFYSSRSYFDYREQYREKLGDVAIHPTDATWDKWINFNFNRIEDQIYYMDHKLEQYKRR